MNSINDPIMGDLMPFVAQRLLFPALSSEMDCISRPANLGGGIGEGRLDLQTKAISI